LSTSTVFWQDFATKTAQEQTVAHRSVTDNRPAFDDFCGDVEVVIGKQHPNALADGRGIPAYGDQKSFLADANPDVASEAQDTVRAWFK
jgi:hypothetical protein